MNTQTPSSMELSPTPAEPHTEAFAGLGQSPSPEKNWFRRKVRDYHVALEDKSPKMDGKGTDIYGQVEEGNSAVSEDHARDVSISNSPVDAIVAPLAPKLAPMDLPVSEPGDVPTPHSGDVNTVKAECANCGATRTPLWRRGLNNELNCNACGLYCKLHKRPRPKSIIVSHRQDHPQCSNCKTTTTPLWRKDDEGKTVCNACGLYYKLHGSHRPISSKASVIRRRSRHGRTHREASGDATSGNSQSPGTSSTLSNAPRRPPRKVDTVPEDLRPTLSSWLRNMSRLSLLIDRLHELASSVPSNHRRQLYQQVNTLRASFSKQQERYTEFLKLTEEYANRYLLDISAAIKEQSSFLDILEQRLDMAKKLRGQAVGLRSAYENGTGIRC
ncbi:hypothetical protein BC834DRAFT_299573 [Gloeopeniophorella convolvens]|nr:hypothetical protein BC834DRAFT_299573 [Gloeopeniophorella convolvens]